MDGLLIRKHILLNSRSFDAEVRTPTAEHEKQITTKIHGQQTILIGLWWNMNIIQ